MEGIKRPGEIVREFCESHEMTQAELARRLGISRPYANRLLNDENFELSGQMILQLADLTEKPPAFWLKAQEDHNAFRNDPEIRRSYEIQDLIQSFELRGSRVLVDQEIRIAVEYEYLRISPFFEDHLQPASYDFSLGDTAIIIKKCDSGDDKKEKEFRSCKNEKVFLNPEETAHVQAVEEVQLPKNILGRLGANTDFIQDGIFYSIGLQIDPGYEGKLFVAIQNKGAHPVPLEYGTPFLSVEFSYFCSTPEKLHEGGRKEFSDKETSAGELMEEIDSTSEINQLKSLLGEISKKIDSLQN